MEGYLLLARIIIIIIGAERKEFRSVSVCLFATPYLPQGYFIEIRRFVSCKSYCVIHQPPL